MKPTSNIIITSNRMGWDQTTGWNDMPVCLAISVLAQIFVALPFEMHVGQDNALAWRQLRAEELGRRPVRRVRRVRAAAGGCDVGEGEGRDGDALLRVGGWCPVVRVHCDASVNVLHRDILPGDVVDGARLVSDVCLDAASVLLSLHRNIPEDDIAHTTFAD